MELDEEKLDYEQELEEDKQKFEGEQHILNKIALGNFDQVSQFKAGVDCCGNSTVQALMKDLDYEHKQALFLGEEIEDLQEYAISL